MFGITISPERDYRAPDVIVGWVCCRSYLLGVPYVGKVYRRWNLDGTPRWSTR